MDLTKLFSVAFGPLAGVVQGFRSMRFFNLLDRGNTPKLLRVSKRRIGLFRLQQVQTGLSPLHVAAQLGYTDAVNVMLNRREARSWIDSDRNQNAWTPLHCAAAKGQLDVVKLLLDNKATLHARTKDGYGCMHLAAGHGHDEVIDFLSRKGLSINDVDSHSQVPLTLAAMNGQLDTVKHLIENKAITNTPDEIGLTPIYYAIASGDLEMVKFLHRFPYKNKEAKYDLVHAASHQQESDILQFLLSRGHDPNQVDSNRASPLHYAAQGKSISCTQYLLSQGCNPNARDSMFNTPLHTAVVEQNIDVVQILHEAGSDREVINKHGLKPKEIAAAIGDREIRRYFSSFDN